MPDQEPPIQQELRACTMCTHFDIDFGDVGYSSQTPGGPGSISCRLDIWEVIGTPTESDFYRVIATAKWCAAWTQRKTPDDEENLFRPLLPGEYFRIDRLRLENAEELDRQRRSFTALHEGHDVREERKAKRSTLSLRAADVLKTRYCWVEMRCLTCPADLLLQVDVARPEAVEIPTFYEPPQITEPS